MRTDSPPKPPCHDGEVRRGWERRRRRRRRRRKRRRRRRRRKKKKREEERRREGKKREDEEEGLSGPSLLLSRTTISLGAFIFESKISYSYDCTTIKLPQRQFPWGHLTS